MTDAQMNSGKGRGWKGLILPVCIIAAAAYMIFLGNWQMQRLAWKESLIAKVEQNLSKPPVAIEKIQSLLKNGENIEYVPVQVEGRFRHDLEQYYFATFREQPGWYVYTPLERVDGSVLFLNRGFVPINMKDPALRAEGQVEGIVKITGLARTAPKERPNSFVPDNNLKKNEYFWKSLEQMAENTGIPVDGKLLPFFVDANNAPNKGGLPVGGVTMIKFPNSHLQYALTWYGLAATLLVVGGIFMFKRRKEQLAS